MPPIFAGRRRGLFVSLVLVGVLQAVLAVIMTLQVEALLSGDTRDPIDFWAVAISVTGIGLSRWIERVVAEDTGQDYVFEQRNRLITAAVGSPDFSGSLGVTVTRASNDLSAVRNWIALGIVPLVTGIPLIIVVVIALLFMDLQVGIAVAVPLLIVVALIPILARITLNRAQYLRRQRGRMSARIADTVMAGESVRASGAVKRELKAVNRDSRRVVDAAVSRAWITGFTRSLTATASSLCTVGVVLMFLLGLVEPAKVASTMMLLGIIATPVTDMGRVVEYRQNFRAASRKLIPMLTEADELLADDASRTTQPHDGSDSLIVSNHMAAGYLLPDLHVRPGDRVWMKASDPARIRNAVASLGSVVKEGTVIIDGVDLAVAPATQRRALIGSASAYVPLERGTVRRLASYRVPDATDDEIRGVLDDAGLKPVVQNDERGLQRRLANGGKPWTTSQVMQLKVARAMLGSPDVLILEGLDGELSEEVRERLARVLESYPGIILFSSLEPHRWASDFQEWDVEGTYVESELVKHEVADDDE